MNKALEQALKEAKENYELGLITREEYLNIQRKVNRLNK